MTMKSKTVVFFGNEKLATGISTVEPIIQKAVRAAGFNIEQVITGQLSELRPHTAEIAVLAAYGRIIPKSILDQFPLGIINVHPSLLPAYRGPTPIEQAILDGAEKTGVSIMQLTTGMDEGPIYTQKTVHLSGKESKNDLTKYLQTVGAELISDVLPMIFNGGLKPRQQPHPARATYSHKLSKNNSILDWNKPALQLEREIRAYLGWPGSKATIAGKDVTITLAHTVPASGSPGQFIRTKKHLIVVTSKNGLCIDRIKPAGKNEMSISAFLVGYGNLI